MLQGKEREREREREREISSKQKFFGCHKLSQLMCANWFFFSETMSTFLEGIYFSILLKDGGNLKKKQSEYFF